MVEARLDRVPLEQLERALPVREFRSYKGRKHYSGWYWAATTGHHVVYESLLELRRIMLADFDSEVRAIVAQPFQMVVEVDGKLRRHVPDLLLLRGEWDVSVVNVKPAQRVSDPRVQSTFAWAAAAVTSMGWGFEVWSGADAVLLENVRFLAGYRRSAVVRRDLVPMVLAAAEVQDSVGGIEAALAEAAPVELVRPVVMHLLWTGALTMDLTRPLGRRSPVGLRRGA